MDKHQRRSRWINILTAVIIIVAILAVYIFSIGRILVKDDSPQQADAAFVLQGLIPSRILHAVDLYHEGQISKIIMVEEYKSADELLDEKGVEILLFEQLNKDIAMQLGVPEDDIIILPGAARSTKDEAIILGEYLSTNDYFNSITIVTSPSHSFRSFMITDNALNKLDREVILSSQPTTYEDFNPSRWFLNRENIEEVIFETIKTLSYYLIEQFQF